jgi:hypothetical protein
MKSGESHPKARQYLEQLAASGRYSFTSTEAQAALGVSAKAAVLALNRLAKQGLPACRAIHPGADEAPRSALLRLPAVGR